MTQDATPAPQQHTEETANADAEAPQDAAAAVPEEVMAADMRIEAVEPGEEQVEASDENHAALCFVDDGELPPLTLASLEAGEEQVATADENHAALCIVDGGALPPLRLASLDEEFGQTGALTPGGHDGPVGSGTLQAAAPRFHLKLATMELADPWSNFGPQREGGPVRIGGEAVRGGRHGDGNHTPTGIEPGEAGVDENAPGGAVVARLHTIDRDRGDSHYYEIVGGHPLFEIDGDEIRLKPGATLDYETQDGYDLTIRSTDGHGKSVTETVHVAVRDVNEAPTAIAPDYAAVDENAGAGTLVAQLGSTDPDRGDSHSYEIVGGHPLFEIYGDTIRVKAGAQLDYEAQDGYDLTVRSTDAHGLSITETVHVRVRDVNEAPTAIAPDYAAVDENAAAGTLVPRLGTTDPDRGDSHSYEIIGGHPLFEIYGDTIRVKPGAQLGYEAQDGYDLIVRSTDAHGLSVTETVHVVVRDLNEAPTAIAPDYAAVDENAAAGTLVAQLGTTDPDRGDSHSYEIVGGSTLFEVYGDTIRVKPGAQLDYEAQDGYDLTVRSTDAHGLSITETVHVAVRDLNEAPTAIAPDYAAVDENAAAGTLVAQLGTADPDRGDSHSYEIVGGHPLFEIDGDTIRVKPGAQLDYETQDGYDLTVRSTDAHGLSVTETVHVTVRDVNEAPTATAMAGQTATAGSHLSLATAGHFSDVDHGDQLTYSMSGPAWLSIDPHTGVISGTVPANLAVQDIAIEDGLAQVPPTGVLHLQTDMFANSAGYLNSFGYYFADASGNPIGGAIVESNAHETGQHETFIDLAKYPGAASIGFFIVENGQANFPSLQDGTEVTFSQVGGFWKAYAGATLLDDGANQSVLFSNASLNGDGLDHIKDTGAPGNLNWEDLWGGGDRDFDDINISAKLQYIQLSPGASADHTVTVTATDQGGLSAHGSFDLHLTNGNAAFAALGQGDAGANSLNGSAAADILSGGAGNDTLSGNGGNDYLVGGTGDDILNGGAGSDILIGGDGADRFVVSNLDMLDTVYGGAGGTWLDVIDLSPLNMQHGTDWTVVLEQGSILAQSAHDITLSADAHGYIKFGGETRIAFHEVESIHS